jgi:hypothetical protein
MTGERKRRNGDRWMYRYMYVYGVKINPPKILTIKFYD